MRCGSRVKHSGLKSNFCIYYLGKSVHDSSAALAKKKKSSKNGQYESLLGKQKQLHAAADGSDADPEMDSELSYLGSTSDSEDSI